MIRLLVVMLGQTVTGGVSPSFTMQDVTNALATLGALYPIWFIMFIAAVFFVIGWFVRRHD